MTDFRDKLGRDSSGSRLERDALAAADHLDSLGRELSYDEFVDEIKRAVPSPESDIHWMADNQLVGIFFARQLAAPEALTADLRRWAAEL